MNRIGCTGAIKVEFAEYIERHIHNRMALYVTDIIDSVKARFSKPFFGTYAVTFLFVNWHIPVGLLMLSKEDIIELGYGNWVAFIDYHLSFSKGVAMPLSLSLSAVIALPFIMSEYKILQAKALNSFNLNQKKHAKDRYIEMEKYLQLWQTYDGKLDQLEIAITKAEVFKDEKAALDKQVEQYGLDIENWKKKKDELDKELRHLNGKVTGLENILKDTWKEVIPQWLEGTFKLLSFTDK